MINRKYLYAIVIGFALVGANADAQEKSDKDFLNYAHDSASRYIFNDVQSVILIHPKKMLEGSLGIRLKPVFDGYVKSFLKHVTDQNVDPTELETMVVYLMGFTPEQAAERMTPGFQTSKYKHPKFHSVYLQFATDEASERFFEESKKGKQWKKASRKDVWVSGSKDNRFLMHPTGKLRSYVVTTQWKFQKMIAQKDVNSEIQEMVRSIKDPKHGFGFIQLNDATRKQIDPLISLIGKGSEHLLAANKLCKAIKFRLYDDAREIYVEWIPVSEVDNTRIGEHVGKFVKTALLNLNTTPPVGSDPSNPVTSALRLYQHFLLNVAQPKSGISSRPSQRRPARDRPCSLRYSFPRTELVTQSPKQKLDAKNFEDTAEPELYKATERLKILNTATRIWLAKHKTYPDNSPLAGGKHPVSWRVKLLPYLEEPGLFKQYRTNEPWDSSHNKKLIKQMPAVFGESGSKSNIVRLIGDTIFGDGQQSIDPQKSPSGFPWNQETIFLIAVDDDKAIEWTKPDDLKLDGSERDHAKLLNQLGNINNAESIAFLQFDQEEAYWPKRMRQRSTFQNRGLVKMLLGK